LTTIPSYKWNDYIGISTCSLVIYVRAYLVKYARTYAKHTLQHTLKEKADILARSYRRKKPFLLFFFCIWRGQRLNGKKGQKHTGGEKRTMHTLCTNYLIYSRYSNYARKNWARKKNPEKTRIHRGKKKPAKKMHRIKDINKWYRWFVVVKSLSNLLRTRFGT